MSAAGLLAEQRSFSGLRALRPQRDLAQVADLVETCFATSLDSSGHAAVREMRMMGRSGPLLWSLGRLMRAIPAMHGFVWLEQGQIVGNVSIAPAGFGRGWVIANVAVYPQFRRRGIARRMMLAALDWVARHGPFALLQVEADNEGAQQLYRQLGFVDQRTFTRWRRAAHYRAPEVADDAPLLQRLKPGDASRLFALGERLRPNTRGGMGWLRPTYRAALRPDRWGGLRYWLSGQFDDFWVVTGAGEELSAALCSRTRLGGLTVSFDLLVHPDCQGTLETALVAESVRRLAGRRQPLLTEHPADDAVMVDALHAHHFRPERTLVHMLWTPESESER